VQSSEPLSTDRIRRAVMISVRRHGPRGCAALVAHEFGDHPDTAVNRMGWVLDAVRIAYA
jgi:hypothetical protein